MTWPRVDLPGQIPYGTFVPVPTAPGGVAVLPVPLCKGPTAVHDRLDTTQASRLRPILLAAARAVAPAAKIGELVERHTTATRPGGRDSYSYSVDITDDGGTGSIMLSLGDFTGPPLAAADAHAFDQANCAPPKRKVLGDGTVLQVYSVLPSEPFQSLTQVVRVFRPDNELVQVTVANWGSPDIRPDPGRAPAGITFPVTPTTGVRSSAAGRRTSGTCAAPPAAPRSRRGPASRPRGRACAWRGSPTAA